MIPAPEIALVPYVCPWLSRVAGRYIERPDLAAFVIARLYDGLATVGRAFEQLTPALQAAGAAVLKFGAAFNAACDPAAARTATPAPTDSRGN